MKSTLVRIAIFCFLYIYTCYKILQCFPHHLALAQVITLGIFISMITGMRSARRGRMLGLLANLLTGFWSIFIVLSIPADLCLLLYKLVTSSSITTLSRDIENFIVVLTALLSMLGFIEVWRGPLVKKIICKIPNLPNDLQNFRIVQLSDLHVGPTIKRKYIVDVVKQSNALEADVIFVTGDIADAKPQSVLADIQPLNELSAQYGVYYVTGNHEYYWGAEDWITAVAKLGMIPLINENRILQINQAHLMIAGITDDIGGGFIAGHTPDLSKALVSSSKPDLKILLAHRPSVYIAAEKEGIDLQFSGHTHGGQYFPFNLLVSFFHTYYRHLNRYKNLWLYVNIGTGYWGPMNRFGVRSEITLCILVKE